MRKPLKILLFCEGSLERGFGHVGRCLALATELRDEHESKCIFVFRGNEAARNKICNAGFEVIEVSDFNSYKFTDEAAVVLDLLISLEEAFFANASAKNILICTIDDPTPNRLKSELAFYPPVPQVQELDWDNFSGELFCGWQYIPLRKEFTAIAGIESHKEESSIPKLLITAGGSDPAELTAKILQSLSSVKEPWHAKVIIGPMFKNLDRIKKIAVKLGDRVELISNVQNIARLMVQSDATVASFGITAYELATCRTPQLLLNLTDNHVRSASALHDTGAAISLGRYDLVTDQELIESLQKFISDAKLRAEMVSNAEKLDIGHGASNIATAIIKRLESRNIGDEK
ncbi:Spore coat polysaccharide biosynthesis protein SpsG, predicted glycosyltransferase [Maridesulfovibrio ferrireducens]|uniref:Spore coat polysaccharide biosynthesis protein SpsG, predicted glycosyltransferase n=1 Tax=Maridesulfovibrio ferrireducens TaxID=246191 RepID=A0A1G9B4N0_9BACT|nr:acylneuraminate cytidylyltransferase [Maridesulfovibrio ferrireducens]SDK34449.1 Spore coat polysaccharide biosynthesis protein SpsG, predicted glycosyltransferase [Maridesulfovibrio ferrireducens]